MSRLTQDLHVAARGLRRQPGLALAAILTLALGIGVNSAIFSIVDSILLTPPPFREPERLVLVWASNSEIDSTEGLGVKGPISNALLYDWQKESRSFEKLGMLQATRMVFTGMGEPELLGVALVSGDFFGVLGTPAAPGRTIDPKDDTLGTPTVVVLSHAFWQRRFGGAPDAVGKVITLGGNPFTVIGVMPPRFTFPRGGAEIPGPYGFAAETDVWVPLALGPEARQDRSARGNVAIGRLRPGVDRKAADVEIQAITARLSEAYPQTDAGWGAYLQPILEQMRGGLKPALIVLWAAVGVVLLIACANVANLLLARAASRQKEIAVRMAIGAGRRRLVHQLLAESALLCLLGGALGVFLAWAGLRTFAAYVPSGLIEATSFSLSWRAIAFTAALCIAATVLAGLVPALQMSRPDLAGSLREGTRAGAGTAGSGRTRNALVVAEVALAVLLLIGAGLLLRSFFRLLAVDPGFRPEHILTFELGMPPDRYPPPARLPFLERIVEQVRSVPGVTAAAIISDLPTDANGGYFRFTIEGRPELPPDQAFSQVALVRSASPGYFEMMGIPLRRGRLPSGADRDGTMLVAVVDEAMARTFWPGEDPVGQRFRIGRRETWHTVVGVVGGVREAGLQGEVQPGIYVVASQNPQLMNFLMRIAVRTEGDPEALTADVRRAVHAVDPDQPVSRIRTLEQMVSSTVAKPRFSLLLLGLFAALALVLALVGIYGITSYSVSRRTRELGLRMALGARPQGILGMVLRETALLAGLGVLLGLAAAFALTRVMTSLLYGVEATDPSTFVAVSLGLVLISLLAAYLPGRRATRVDPIVALRNE